MENPIPTSFPQPRSAPSPGGVEYLGSGGGEPQGRPGSGVAETAPLVLLSALGPTGFSQSFAYGIMPVGKRCAAYPFVPVMGPRIE